MLNYLLAIRLAKLPVLLAFLLIATVLTIGVMVMGTRMHITPAHAADQSLKTATPATSTGENDTVASGAVEDTLKACLARIPKDATAGQRMIAEQGCKRDQADRQSFQNVPGR